MRTLVNIVIIKFFKTVEINQKLAAIPGVFFFLEYLFLKKAES